MARWLAAALALFVLLPIQSSLANADNDNEREMDWQPLHEELSRYLTDIFQTNDDYLLVRSQGDYAWFCEVECTADRKFADPAEFSACYLRTYISFSVNGAKMRRVVDPRLVKLLVEAMSPPRFGPSNSDLPNFEYNFSAFFEKDFLAGILRCSANTEHPRPPDCSIAPL